MNYHLCDTCNLDGNYYPKLNDESNRDSFIQCYDKNVEQIGYYVDNVDKIFKPCYNKCKRCEREGDDTNNYCLECNDEDKIADANGNCKCKFYYNYQTSECIDSVPPGYYLKSSSDNIIDKCPSKCATCSSDSINENLCISCNINDNFYPKLNDESNKDSFIQCYDKNVEQIGYYVDNDNKIFKPCYNKCKRCERAGDDTNNNCLECNDEDKIADANGNCKLKLVDSSIIISQNIDEKKEKQYSYNINSNSEETKLKTNRVYIDINQETMNFLKNKFSLINGEKIFITIIEKTNNGSNLATVDYIYEYYLENGTKLNTSNLGEEISVDVYVPLTDLDLAQFELYKQFAEQGYDIYDINNKFYTDFCTPASIGDNDITLEDRMKYIYPHNVTLCKSNCRYKGINIEEQRVICECNINSDINVNENSKLFKDEDNFIDYLIDKVNYRLFLCYKLFFNAKNLRTSNSFFIILLIDLIMIILDITYISYSIERLKIYMARVMFSKQIINKEIINEPQKIIESQESQESQEIDSNDNKIANPLKKDIENKKKSKGKGLKGGIKSQKNVMISISKFTDKLGDSRNYEKVVNTERANETWDEKECPKEENINELPYSKAIDVDKRNIIHIFYSFIIEKLELISIYFYEYQIKSILLSEYILNLLTNFFFNALLYSDDVVSNKYHNNGKLDFAVSLVLSIVSNIITSIICYYVKYSRGIEDKVKLILEIKYKMPCYRNLRKFFKYLKMKFACFVITQFIIAFTCIYYTVIFCIKYSHSQKSLVVNYCYSLVESIIMSFGITTIILITRKIGLSCLNKELYNTSKYINSKF